METQNFYCRNLFQLKSFVLDEIYILYISSSPDGETKVFKNSEITLKWSDQTREKLIIVEDNEVDLVAKTLNTLLSKNGITRLNTAIVCSEPNNKAQKSRSAEPVYTLLDRV